MFTILGFVASVAILLYITFAYIVVILGYLWDYNAGGATNTAGANVVVVVVGVVIGTLWYQLFHHSPFTITFS